MTPSYILFDLDGTLLPMDQEAFVKIYFAALAKKICPYGYDSDLFLQALIKGVKAMTTNDGTMTNETRFWEVASDMLGAKIRTHIPVFESFYSNEFHTVKAATAPNPLAKAAVHAARMTGAMVILATNPLFPACAVASRISWIGLAPEDFDYITTYETNSYCKPNPDYYKDILKHIGARPEQCVMIGNDVTEDILASKAAGIASYLVTDCAIWEKEKENQVPDGVPYGSFTDMLAWIKSL